jgi:hypothetical protein
MAIAIEVVMVCESCMLKFVIKKNRRFLFLFDESPKRHVRGLGHSRKRPTAPDVGGAPRLHEVKACFWRTHFNPDLESVEFRKA